MVETRRLCGALGAEVSGVNLSKPLDEDTARSVVDAYHEHLVLVFRGQSLDPAAQIAFTQLFGEPYEHPLRTRANVDGYPEVLIIETRPGRMGARNDYWHSDISHQECPPAASILHALEVPDGLGDTMFCNMYRAAETLSPGMQRLLDGMEAMHSGEATMRRAQEKGTDALRIDSVPPPTAHPILRTHPGTGRRALFVNPHFTVSFKGMTEEESAPLLDYLAEHSTRPENIYRHRWSVGDVVVWDNRCTMHYAVRDYDDTVNRKHHRTTASGERPF
ncbi:MAG: TauD/TfdA family dioxygenase [Gammaproteobacteria bacterium]|nr:TauD/TfdA family dioxygenase [Gammaproteobacteria bacterium]